MATATSTYTTTTHIELDLSNVCRLGPNSIADRINDVVPGLKTSTGELDGLFDPVLFPSLPCATRGSAVSCYWQMHSNSIVLLLVLKKIGPISSHELAELDLLLTALPVSFKSAFVPRTCARCCVDHQRPSSSTLFATPTTSPVTNRTLQLSSPSCAPTSSSNLLPCPPTSPRLSSSLRVYTTD